MEKTSAGQAGGAAEHADAQLLLDRRRQPRRERREVATEDDRRWREQVDGARQADAEPATAVRDRGERVRVPVARVLDQVGQRTVAQPGGVEQRGPPHVRLQTRVGGDGNPSERRAQDSPADDQAGADAAVADDEEAVDGGHRPARRACACPRPRPATRAGRARRETAPATGTAAHPSSGTAIVVPAHEQALALHLGKRGAGHRGEVGEHALGPADAVHAVDDGAVAGVAGEIGDVGDECVAADLQSEAGGHGRHELDDRGGPTRGAVVLGRVLAQHARAS